MKRFVFAVIALTALAIGLEAQSYSTVNLLNGTTDRIVAGATSNYSTAAFTADVRKQKNIGILLSWKMTGSGTDNTVITFERSLDNSTWDGTHTFALTKANNGTTVVTVGTNLALNGFGYIRLKSIVNGDSGDAVTNLLLQYAIKQAD